MKRVQNLIPLVKPYYHSSDPAHDWAHVCRVAATAEILSAGQDINLECVLAGVYCHDLVNLPKNHPNRGQASLLSAQEAEALLKKVEFNEDEILSIKKSIIEHSFSKGLKPSSMEAAIIQDSDRLDALGAIGILRCAAVNTKMGSSFYEPMDPMAKFREPDDKSYMLDHYSIKLYKLPTLMNTQRGRELALKRVEFMKEFVSEFIKEIRVQ